MGTLHPEEGTIHAICTEMDHNSVLRPLYRLEKKGMELTILPADRKGRISLTELEAAIRPETKVRGSTDTPGRTQMAPVPWGPIRPLCPEKQRISI